MYTIFPPTRHVHEYVHEISATRVISWRFNPCTRMAEIRLCLYMATCVFMGLTPSLSAPQRPVNPPFTGRSFYVPKPPEVTSTTCRDAIHRVRACAPSHIDINSHPTTSLNTQCREQGRPWKGLIIINPWVGEALPGVPKQKSRINPGRVANANSVIGNRFQGCLP